MSSTSGSRRVKVKSHSDSPYLGDTNRFMPCVICCSRALGPEEPTGNFLTPGFCRVSTSHRATRCGRWRAGPHCWQTSTTTTCTAMTVCAFLPLLPAHPSSLCSANDSGFCACRKPSRDRETQVRLERLACPRTVYYSSCLSGCLRPLATCILSSHASPRVLLSSGVPCSTPAPAPHPDSHTTPHGCLGDGLARTRSYDPVEIVAMLREPSNPVAINLRALTQDFESQSVGADVMHHWAEHRD